MIPSIFVAFVTVLSSFAAANGAVIQRDGTFTYITPQPTFGQSTTTTTTSSRPTTLTSTTTSASVFSTIPTSTLTSTVQPSSFTSTRPTTLTSSSTTSPFSTLSSSCTVCPPTGTTTPTPTGTGAANCNGVQQWQASFAYTAGNRVIFNGQLFTATQWTYNNAPPAHPDQWAAGGTCIQPINNKVNCAGVSAWLSTVAYTAGNRVTYNGHLWSAVQWTQSNVPGDTSGSWKDEGACA